MVLDQREELLREASCHGNSRSVLQYLVAGVNINSQNRINGWTALHWAACRGHENVIKMLLENGADAKIKNQKGQTAIDVAKDSVKHCFGLVASAGNDNDKNDDEDDERNVFKPAYLRSPNFLAGLTTGEFNPGNLIMSDLYQFPFHGLLPKNETEAASFVKKHPEYDGRGTVIAVLDTGIDPGAPGLQLTSDGKPKILDVIDCCGSGDVTLVDVEPLPNKNEIIGLSGRTIKLNSQWINPTGKYRLGLKRAYELFPKGLISRVSGKVKEKMEVDHQLYIARALEELSKIDPQSVQEAVVRKRQDLNNRISVLKDLISSFDDIGPLLDCLVFHDGTNWLAAIDVSESGDLSNAKALADFSVEHQWGVFSEESSHGTHVAGIIGAFHGPDSEENGVAAGAQLISLKIGETRLGSMETGTGLTRAAIAIAKYRCNLANMSYGEAPNIANSGHFTKQLKELALKYNVVFVSSAGNGGPALSTVGSPGGTSSYVIGVGAYVTPSMAKAEYALMENIHEIPYTWSSRGPASDGDVGVSIYAPGGAITSVPNWTLQTKQLMNGTSMSSPNACGCISLVLSALKAKKIVYTPMRIKRAIENSSRSINDPFLRGVIQVEKSFNYINDNYSFLDNDIYFEISFPDRQKDRGLYIRSYEESRQAVQATVQITPVFMDNAPSQMKIDFEVHLALISTQSWIRNPEYLQLNNGGEDISGSLDKGRSFSFTVDTPSLSPGWHFAEIQAFDVKKPERGPIFRVPITVVKPSLVEKDYSVTYTTLCKSGDIERRFFLVPMDATFAAITINSCDIQKPSRVIVHALQLIGQDRYPLHEFEKAITLHPNTSSKELFSVVGGKVIEIDVCAFWSNAGICNISVKLEFHGIRPSSSKLVIEDGIQRIELSPLYRQSLSPSGSFDRIRKTIPPSQNLIHRLGERDVLASGKQIMEIILTYSFQIPSNTSVMPIFTCLANYLYDSPLDGILFLLFDKNKRYISCGDIYPKKIKLNAGDYTLRLSIRHESADVLEGLVNLALKLDVFLAKEIALDFYSSVPEFLLKTKLPGEQKIEYDSTIFVSATVDEKTIDDGKVGDVLIGSLTFETKSLKHPKGFPIQFLINPFGKKESKPLSDKTECEKLVEQIRDCRINSLAKLKEQDRTPVIDILVKDFPNHPSFLLELLRIEDSGFNGFPLKCDGTKEKAMRVIEAADKVLGVIKTDELVQFLGTRQNESDPSVAAKKKELLKLKEILCESLCRKLRAIAVANDPDLWSQTFSFATKWIEFGSGLDSLSVFIWDEVRNGRLGNALKAVIKALEKPISGDSNLLLSEKELYNIKSQLFDRLGWKFWSLQEDSWQIVRFPKEFMGF